MNLNPVALAAFRQTRNLSQSGLAKLSGVSQGHISDLESGERLTITPKTATKLAAVLGIPVEAFAAISINDKALAAVRAAS